MQLSVIRWGGDDAFTHMLCVGPTRCGKTATVLKPMIYQILLQKAQGLEVGLSVVEPKGDVAGMVAEMCHEMDIQCFHVDPSNPNSDRFPVMKGDIDDVAEATVVVLKSMFGKQDAFFATVQELAGRNITKLLKTLRGDDVDLADVLKTMRDQATLEDRVAELHRRDGETELVQFFRSELLGAQKDRYQQFVLGLRAQLENLTSNRHLEPILTGASEFNMDKHFADGGVLAVNTDMGRLRGAGDAFGQFVIMHLQSGTFRRPGTEKTRIPHYMIIDEYSRYINPDVELFLSIAAEFRTAGIFAIQSLGQLEVEAGKINARAMKKSIMTSCRNKIAFGGLAYEDALEFSREFGKKQIIRRESTFKQQVIIPNILPESYRDTEKEEDRILYTQMMDGLPRFHYVTKLLQNGTPQPPQIGRGNFVPRNWKELREWERKKSWWRIVLNGVQMSKPKTVDPAIQSVTNTKDQVNDTNSSNESKSFQKLVFVDESQQEVQELQKIITNESSNPDQDHLAQGREIQVQNSKNDLVRQEKRDQSETIKTPSSAPKQASILKDEFS